MFFGFRITSFQLLLLFIVIFGCVQQSGEQIAEDHSDMDHDEHSVEDNSELKHSFIETFGPGEKPHLHALNLEDFDVIEEISRSASDVPVRIDRNSSETVRIELVAKEVVSDIADGISFNYWTFNGRVPGPFLRVREGDMVELTLRNDESSSHEHSIDLHAVTGPGGGAAVLRVKPGEEKSLRFKALNPGLFIYHCASGNVPLHISHGLYGLILVEPEQGLERVDKEFFVVQGELFTEGDLGVEGFQNFSAQKMLDEQPEYIFFNGRVNSLVDAPLKAEVGEKVRIFVGNSSVANISSFHVVGEIFDSVFPLAATEKLSNVQTTIIPAGGASIVEFELNVPGKYVLVDHALSRIERGAWGILNVTGQPAPEIYTEINK